MQLAVENVEALRRELTGRGVETSPVEVHPWGSFIFFSDPDGNKWAVQQLPTRG